MSSKKVAEIVVETLEAAGVRHCYGIVGDTLNHVTDAIHRSQIQWVHVRHEEAAAFAAGAESHISGRLTACAGSCGPGSLHFINGVYEAQRNRAPMVLIASQIVTPQLGMEFPQEVDFKAVYASCSVFCEQVHSPEQARRVVALACQAALNRRGVAVVILPADISQATVKDDLPFSVHFPQPVLRPSDAELQDVARLLAHGKKIGIYAGSGCQGAHDLLVALADRLKAPIAHTSRAKDFVEYDNPFNMGMTGMLGIESGFHMMTECDTLLLLGADFAWAQFYPQKATLIQVDRNGSHLGRRHPIDLGVVGDVIPTLEALLPLLEAREERSFLDECLEHRERSLRTLEKRGASRQGRADPSAAPGQPARPARQRGRPVHRRRRLGDGLAVASHPQQRQAPHPHQPGPRHHGQRHAPGAGTEEGLPRAPGDLDLRRRRPGHAARRPADGHPGKLPIKVVVLNNASLNFVELEQKVEGLLDNYTDLLNPDFARLAEVIGFHGRKVTRSEELEAAVQEFPRPARSGAAGRAYQPCGAGDAAEDRSSAGSPTPRSTPPRPCSAGASRTSRRYW